MVSGVVSYGQGMLVYYDAAALKTHLPRSSDAGAVLATIKQTFPCDTNVS